MRPINGSFYLSDRQDDLTLNEIDSRMKGSFYFCDDGDVDGLACAKILEWMTSLFVDVARSLMDCDSRTPRCQNSQPRTSCDLPIDDFLTTVPSLSLPDVPGAATTTVKLPEHPKPHVPLAVPINLKASPLLIGMPGENSEPLLPDQVSCNFYFFFAYY